MLRNIRFRTMFLFTLVFGIFIEFYASSKNENDVHEFPGSDGNAFFALRSCHQVLHGDEGEFFSPDYQCSNPPLWCNWTIQVDPGKHIRLYLKDFTPSETCHLKLDQIYLAEPFGVSGGNGVLEKCWQEAKYISVSNTLHVVMLIGGSPFPPHRGFYGRYEAFEPPLEYTLHGDDTEGDGKWVAEDEERVMKEQPIVQRSFTYVTKEDGEPAQPILLESPTPAMQADYNYLDEYFDQPTSVSNEIPLEVDEPMNRQEPSRFSPVQMKGRSEETVVKIHHKDNLNWHKMVNPTEDVGPSSFLTSNPTMEVEPTLGTLRSGRRATDIPAPLHSNEVDIQFASIHTHSQGVHTQPVPTSAEDHNTLDGTDADPSRPTSRQDQSSGTMNTVEQIPPTDTLATNGQRTLDNPPPNIVEPLSDNRAGGPTQNHTKVPHLPGDHLFEVSVELIFSSESDTSEHWDNLARTLLMSTKALIYEQLKFLSPSIKLSSKRIKRLSAGVLYILWLQTGGWPEGLKVRSTLHAALQELISTDVRIGVGDATQAVIVSLSTTDVNECATQLVLCDINAECVNHFGSYACRCRPGFEDISRLGSGGTLCVDPEVAGTDRQAQEAFMTQQHSITGCDLASPAGVVQGIYVVCVLLSFLLLLSLSVTGVMYHRHHRGAFLVGCQSSSFGGAPHITVPDSSNNNNSPTDGGCVRSEYELPPPPPPPMRRPKEGWLHPDDCCPPVDVPLLRFSRLLPFDGSMEPREGSKL